MEDIKQYGLQAPLVSMRQIKGKLWEIKISQTRIFYSQPMIGRLEGLKDNRLPSIELLAKIASITKKKLIVSQLGFHLELACI